MADATELRDSELDEGFLVCRREAKLMMVVWLIQSAVMIGLFLALGYYRTDDPFGFPLGVPTWYLIGGVIPAFAFLAVVIYIVKTKFTEVPVR